MLFLGPIEYDGLGVGAVLVEGDAAVGAYIQL